MRTKRRINNGGFSLLELLVVLALMAAAAALALSTLGNRDNQQRFDETRRKLADIRAVIVGEPVVIDGELNLNGFVADMGRLPIDLDELLKSPSDCDGSLDGNGDSDNSNDNCPWVFNDTFEVWHGWNGPYINSVGGDYRDGWGEDWSWGSAGDSKNAYADSHLEVTSNGLNGDFAFDLSKDDKEKDTTNNLVGVDRQYGNSWWQTIRIKSPDYQVSLPHTPLHLSVARAPFCGQCRDKTYDSNQAGCAAAVGRSWSTTHEYCVVNEATMTSATACDALLSTTKVEWVPVYGTCSSGGLNSQSSCTSAGETWTPADDRTSCSTDIGSTSFDFSGGENNFCARPIRINNGFIVHSSHRSVDGSFVSIGLDLDRTSTADDPAYVYNPNVEDATGDANLVVPQGRFAVGLFVYDDSETPKCTARPFPSKSGQGFSKMHTLSSQYPPNLGTSSRPLVVEWRSR